MFVEHEQVKGENTSQERRRPGQPDARVIGHVVQCDGSRATIAAFANENEEGSPERPEWSVGRLISIRLRRRRTVGLVYAIGKADRRWDADRENGIEVSVELIGEISDHTDSGKPIFDRGITAYPPIGAIAHHIRQTDLAAIYDLGGREATTIGNLSQDASLEARIAIDDTLSRHFAIVGTTGVGKSTAVSLLVRKAIEARPDLRVLLLDPHNEFASAFKDHAIRIDTTTLDLPFWLFRLEEFVEVLFRGRAAVPEEVDILRDLVPVAKAAFRSSGGPGSLRRHSDAGTLTADTPVPYRIADLLRLIDERIGQLDAKQDRPFYRALRARLEAAIQDPHYRFMFNSKLIEDTIHQTIGKIFRIPAEGRPLTCFELAGLPSEIVNAVCSILARLAFDLALWSEGRLKLMVLCEEAHRYMPADQSLGFAPTRHALSRIAKEGRKYGCSLGIVTQRPGELDPTVLSQCSTIFAMRLANERDKEIVRAAIADSSVSTLSFLSSMGQREAIAFGEGVATTMRMKFLCLDSQFIPGSRASLDDHADGATADHVDLVAIVDKLRNLSRAPANVGLGEPAPQAAQAGDPGYRRPSAAAPRSDISDPEPGEPSLRNTGWRR